MALCWGAVHASVCLSLAHPFQRGYLLLVSTVGVTQLAFGFPSEGNNLYNQGIRGRREVPEPPMLPSWWPNKIKNLFFFFFKLRK